MLPAIGLDYGKVHIGLALAAGPLVEPLASVSVKNLTSVLPRLISQHTVRTLVIGLPEGELKTAVKDFADGLKKTLPAPVPEIILYDETLSSYDARQALFHTTKTRRRNLEHSAAAALILQAWLDSRSLPM